MQCVVNGSDLLEGKRERSESVKKPYFSVIVPAHNAEDRMRRGLDTIRGQTFRDFELIIVCDDCQDRTAEIAREYTDRVYEVGWHSCGKTRNKAS